VVIQGSPVTVDSQVRPGTVASQVHLDILDTLGRVDGRVTVGIPEVV